MDRRKRVTKFFFRRGKAKLCLWCEREFAPPPRVKRQALPLRLFCTRECWMRWEARAIGNIVSPMGLVKRIMGGK